MINSKKGFFLLLLSAVLQSFISVAQNDAPLIKKANAEFELGNYSSAINDYRQLLAKEPKSIDFNYKYATCLYHIDDINKAAKYYDLILNMYEPPIESYFYRGKIYQNNYDFQKAIKSFEKYISLRSKKDVDLGAEIELNHCKNAQFILGKLGSVKTIKRFEANKSDFYKTYAFSNEMYDFYTIDDVFAKQNRKKNYKPTYAFIRGMKYRVFASYGPNSESGKDIYIQKKDAENNWSEPVRLGLEVNSNADEDFPFYDEENGILYFSSTGHNSMGGYDIFKVNFDLAQNLVSNRENLNFPYSSPNDDLFLVPDLKTKNAYFASNRNGQLSKVEVFLIELSDKPIQLSFIVGKLTDQIDQLNNGVQINITSDVSKERFGPFYSDNEGNYLISVPKEGAYSFQVKVEGSEKEFTQLVQIPKLNDSKKLEQEIIYSTRDSKENLEIINRVLDKESTSAQLELKRYKELAKLEVNAATLVAQTSSENQSALTDLGYNDQDTLHAFEELLDDLIDIELDIEKNLKFEEELIIQLDSNQQKIQTLNQELIELDNQITKSTDTREKYKFETEKRSIEREIQNLKKQNYVLANEIQAINENSTITRETYKDLKSFNENLNDNLLNSKYAEANALLTAKKEDLKQLLDNRIEEKDKLDSTIALQLSEQKNSLESKITEQDNQITELNKQLSLNQQKLIVEKNKKEQVRLQTEITQLNKNIGIAQELKDVSKFELTKIQKMQEAKSENKVLIQKIDARAENKSTFLDKKIQPKNKIESTAILNELVENELKSSNSLEEKYEKDITQIKQIPNDNERNSKLKEREEIYQNELKSKLASTTNESEKEILSEQIQLSQSRIIELEENQNQAVTSNLSNGTTTNKSDSTSSTQVAKNDNPVSNQTEKITETSNKDLDTTNSTQVAKNDNPVSNKTEKITETTNKDSNTTDSTQVAKNDNPVSNQTEKITETSNKDSDTTNSTQVAKSDNPVSNQTEKITETSNKDTDTTNSTQVAKNDNPVSNQTEKITETSNKDTDTTNSTQVAKNDNPVSNQTEKITETSNKDTDTTNSTQVSKNDNPVLSQEDLKQANLYNLNALKIDQRVNLKTDELSNATSEKDKQKIKQEIVELQIDAQKEAQRANQVQKSALIAKQFPTLQLVSNKDLVSELNELKIREQEIQQKIKGSKSEKEKAILKDQKNQLAALKTELENKIQLSNKKPDFIVEQPNSDINLADNEAETLRYDVNYQTYIQDRTFYNALVSDYNGLKDKNSELRSQINRKLIESNKTDLSEEIRLLAAQLVENEKQVNEKKLQIENQSARLKSYDKASKFEYLIANKIQPAKRQPVKFDTTELLANFSIGKNQITTVDRPLPINVNSPSGLIYRVQVGAFRKPIPNEAFRDFSPVSGDVLANGLTCYMAGYFNSAQSAIAARKQIRTLGYADAFIVAYCDGKRISFAQGRELENSGRCKVMTINELNLALSGNNPAVNPTESVVNSGNSVIKNETKSTTYLNVPNAKNAELGELNQQLFFTVQVGVYNKPITNNQLTGFDDLVTFKTDKGQIRYSSGMFENSNDAKNHKNQAVTKGVPDAFVVAYYQGKRISIAEANNLLAKNGSDILKKQATEQYTNSGVPNEKSNEQIVEVSVTLPEILVPKKQETLIQFELNCDSNFVLTNLERLNRIGIFTYQPKNAKIVSSKMKAEDVSSIQNLYLNEFQIKTKPIDSSLLIKLDVTKKLSNGSFTDWLLRSELNYRIENNGEEKQLNLYLDNESQRTIVLNKAKELLIAELE